MKRRWIALLASTIIAMFGTLPSTSAAAATGAMLFQDSFDTTSQIDTAKTTAEVNTAAGWIDLACSSGANAIATSATNGNLQSIVAVTSSGIQWFSRDQFSGQMIPMNSMTLTQYQNPLGISLAPNNTLFVFGKDAGQWYVKQALFDGAGLVDNPKMSLSLTGPITGLTAISGTSFAISDSSGNISVYNYNAGLQSAQIDPMHSFSTGLTDIVAIKSIPSTWDFYVVTKHGSFRYSFDQASDSDLINPAFTVSTSSIVAGDGYDNLIAFLDGSASRVYGFDQSYTMTPVGQLSIASLAGAFAVSMPTDTTEVIASKDGTVDTYEYDPASNQMVSNQNLQITGLSFPSECASNGVYQSTSISVGQNNIFELVPSEQDDTGTSISYSMSTNGGSTFASVIPNTWIHLPAGSTNPPAGSNVPTKPLVIQAQLNSQVDGQTPRLTEIELNGYLDVTPPIAPGTPIASPNPNGGGDVAISWSPSVDQIQAPSTGESGIQNYLFRYSTDNGSTWTSWINTDSSNPTYTLNVPANTVASYLLQVEAEDYAGNISQPSPIGSLFVDTNPLGIQNIQVTQIVAPGSGQTTPTQNLPVSVEAGGEVIYQVATTGDAQDVQVTYSDGTTQDLYPQSSPGTSLSDENIWTGYYYPSSSQTIPLTTPDGTVINISNLIVSGLGKTPYTITSPLLVVHGTVGSGTLPFIPPSVSQ